MLAKLADVFNWFWLYSSQKTNTDFYYCIKHMQISTGLS